MIIYPIVSKLPITTSVLPTLPPSIPPSNGELGVDTILTIVSIVVAIVAIGVTYWLGRLQLRIARLQLHQAQDDNADLRRLVNNIERKL
jgi:hypothetical protein